MLKQFLFPTALCLVSTLAAQAQATGQVEVTVVDVGTTQRLAGVRVRLFSVDGTAVGGELRTDAQGIVSIPGLAPGSYRLQVQHPRYGGESANIQVDGDKTVRYQVSLESSDEETFTLRESSDPARDRVVRLPDAPAPASKDRDFIQRQLGDHSLQGVLATVPGLQRNSVGQVHARSEHRGVTYSLNGVQLPIPPSSSVTPLVDPELLQSIQVESVHEASQASAPTGVVVDAVSLPPAGARDFAQYQVKAGNLGMQEHILRARVSDPDSNFSASLGAHTYASELGIDPPHPEHQTLHNQQVGQNYLLQLDGKTGNETLSGTVAYTRNNLQLPLTEANYNAGVRQDQVDENISGVLSWNHPIDDDSDLKTSLSYLRSRQQVRNNGVFTNFQQADATLYPGLAAAGLPADPEQPGAPYLPRTDLLLSQVQPRVDYVKRFSEKHLLKAGLNADFITSDQNVLLLDPGGGGRLPNGAPSFAARVNRDGFYGGLFFSHTVPLGEELSFNYGLRADRFSNGLDVNTGQISPSASLTYALNDSNRLRCSYVRTFQAPPLEIDVSGTTGVRPQRINTYEVAFESQLAPTVNGRLAYVRRDFRDQVDIGLLVPNSGIALFAPLNYPSAFYQALELSLSTSNKVGWNGFVTGTLSEARPLEASSSTSQFVAYNDHDQRVQVTAGVSHRWANGFSAAADIFYGSGFPQIALTNYNAAGFTPYGYTGERHGRIITNLSLQYLPDEDTSGAQFGGGLQVLNLFDDRTLLNFYSDFSGNRFQPQRKVLLNATVRF